jgi:soluble lytic murein transglycosylase-like protein
MIETIKPTNTEMDNNLPVSKYLRSLMLKIVSNKFVKIILFILILTFFNVGAKYPANSESRNSTDIKIMTANALSEKAEYDRYVKMYNDIYEQSLIQKIEFESEIIIPDYANFKDVEYAYNLANELGFSRRTIFRLIYQESSFDDEVISPMGAKGLMQLMPETRKAYAECLQVDTLKLDKNKEDIYIGIYYLKDLFEFWSNRGNSTAFSWKLALASYNAGIGKVLKYKGVPPYKQTTDFIAFILKAHSNPVFYASILKKSIKTNKTNS